jgi:hypothetical protein
MVAHLRQDDGARLAGMRERDHEMSDEDALRRVRFYGTGDLATGIHVPRVAELVEAFDPCGAPSDTTDILELHNVQKYLEQELLPRTYTDEQRDRAQAKIPQIRSAVARHFSTIREADVSAKLAGVDYEYHTDLVDLLGRNKVFERCSGQTVIPALRATGVHLGEMLASRKLVHAYGAQIREELLASPQGAEHIVRKYMQHDARENVFLPPSFMPVDARALLLSYIDSEDANPNYVELIATSKDNVDAGLDAKVKLHAKRRHAEMIAKLFEKTSGLRTGYEVQVSATQSEPVKFEMDRSDGLTAKYAYSKDWLSDTLDNPSILNNFQHLFAFTDQRVILNLPSYTASLGTLEKLFGTRGKNEYRTGAAFRAADSSSLLQTQMYHEFLRSEGRELEDVVSWFFETYLLDEFGAAHFSFTPSGQGTPYLQKARHLFVEMESVANQFALFAKDGELDRELLSMGSEQVRYKEIPSLLEGKYLYPSDGEEISNILRLLFSDQSRLTYISEDLRAESATRLILKNDVAYTDFLDYQRASIDYLIAAGVLVDAGDRVKFVSAPQLAILMSLWDKEAGSYYRLSRPERAEVDDMLDKGWVTRRSSLLTDAEGAYFNYFLNGVEFSNGPELRNKYLHGSQANTAEEGAHYQTYIVALRLTVALVIKMNDDLCMWAEENQREDDS